MEKRLSLLTELIKIARADKEVRLEEYVFLLGISKTLDVPKEKFEELFEKYIHTAPPPFETERILQFYRMVLMVNADNEINGEEMKALRESGFRLGLNAMSIEAVLEEMRNYPNGLIPQEKLLSIFKTYHN